MKVQEYVLRVRSTWPSKDESMWEMTERESGSERRGLNMSVRTSAGVVSSLPLTVLSLSFAVSG